MLGSHTMPTEVRFCLGGEAGRSVERDEGFDVLSEGNEAVV